MKKNTFNKKIFSLIAVFFITFVYLYQIFNCQFYKDPDRMINYDVISYYGYLPATFIYKDYKLGFMDNPETSVNKIWYATAPNGGKVIKTSMGMSIVYAPFFFIAHALAKPLGYEPTGYTIPYSTALVFGCLIYTFIGLLFLRKILLKYYSDIVVSITLLVIGIATNLHHYVADQSTMSHAFSFSLFCLLLYLIEKWHNKQTWTTSILLGLLLGLISLIRPTNCLVIIIFILYNVCSWNDLRKKIQLFLTNYQKIVIIALFCLLVWIPQFLYWKTITGQWFYYSYNSRVQVERFFFSNPALFDTLLGFRKGWLIYTPTMIFAFIGIIFLWKNNRKYFFPILIFLILNIYIISSWWCWWYGGGFGLRAFIESYAFLAIPMASFFAAISNLKKLKYKIPIIVIATVISLLSIFNTIKYHYNSIHFDSMTKEAYFNSFWHVRPAKNFYSLLKEPDYQAAREGKREGKKQ